MGMEAGGRGLLVAAVLAAAAVPVGAPPLTSQLREVLPAAGGFAQAAGPYQRGAYSRRQFRKIIAWCHFPNNT